MPDIQPPADLRRLRAMRLIGERLVERANVGFEAFSPDALAREFSADLDGPDDVREAVLQVIRRRLVVARAHRPDRFVPRNSIVVTGDHVEVLDDYRLPLIELPAAWMPNAAEDAA